MGQVYRARDLKLQQDVALKVLPDAVARDADRRARFERESHVLAALNHSQKGMPIASALDRITEDAVRSPERLRETAAAAIARDEEQRLPLRRHVR
jgi:serine/threonine protein kinase